MGRDCSLLQLRQQCSNATTPKKVDDDALLQRGGRALSLACTRVRAANRPAISLYQSSLGLLEIIGELEFPEWFDWHGGYTLEEASCREEIITRRVEAKYRGIEIDRPS